MKVFLLAAALLFALSSQSQTRESYTVYFDFDSYRLTPQASRAIDSILGNNKKEGNWMEFEVHGHCDSRGSNEYNNSLSEKRARAVQDYLIKKGVNRESFLLVNGAGEFEPLNENRTDEERQVNRRVQINIIKSKAEDKSETKTL